MWTKEFWRSPRGAQREPSHATKPIDPDPRPSHGTVERSPSAEGGELVHEAASICVGAGAAVR